MSETQFGPERVEDNYQNHIGKFTIIKTPNNSYYFGRIGKISGGYFHLCPYYGTDFDSAIGFQRVLVSDRTLLVSARSVESLESIDEQVAERWRIWSNEKQRLESMKALQPEKSPQPVKGSAEDRQLREQ